MTATRAPATTQRRPAPALLTVQETADTLHVSADTVTRAFHKGTLPGFRVGATIRLYAEPVLTLRDGGLHWLLRQHAEVAQVRQAAQQMAEAAQALATAARTLAAGLTPTEPAGEPVSPSEWEAFDAAISTYPPLPTPDPDIAALARRTS